MGGDERQGPARPAGDPGAPANLTRTDTGVEILYDHYKECLSALAAQTRARLRLLVLILVVLGALVIDTLTEDPLIELLTGIELPALKVTDQLKIPPQALISLLWFLLGSLVALMNQKSLLIEEQIGYTRGVEARLDALFGGGWIFKTRIPNRPIFLKVANFFYFPSYVVLLIAGCALVLYGELFEAWCKPGAKPYIVFDVLVFLIFICGSLGRFIVDFQRFSSRRPAEAAPPDSA